MGENTTTIRKLKLDTRVSKEHPVPDMARVKLADCVKRDLPAQLSKALSSVEGESVVRIRRLTVDLAADLALPGDRIAALLAAAIAQAIEQACRSPNDDVIVFPHKASYLAAYLTARLDGETDRWWFESFSGLSVLPMAAAIRTTLLADPAAGQDALLLLPSVTRQHLVKNLTEIEARRIAEEMADEAGTGTAFAGAAQAISASLVETGRNLLSLEGMERAILALYLDVILRKTQLSGRSTLELAKAVVMLHRCDGRKDRNLSAAIMSGNLKLASLLAGHSFPLLLPLFSLSHEMRQDIIGGLAALPSMDGEVDQYPALQSRHTAFGGLAMLLPMLLEPALDEEVHHWPQPSDKMETAQLLRFVILCACAGRERADRVFADPFWRDLFGIEPSFDEEALAIWADSVPVSKLAALRKFYEPVKGRHIFLLPEKMLRSSRLRMLLSRMAYEVLARFSCRLPGFSTSSPEFLWCNLLDIPARIDMSDGVVRIILGRPPLDVLLGMTSVCSAKGILPDGRAFVLERGL